MLNELKTIKGIGKGLTDINFNGVVVEHPLEVAIAFKIDFMYLEKGDLRNEFYDYYDVVKKQVISLYKAIRSDVVKDSTSFEYLSKSFKASLYLAVDKGLDNDYDLFYNFTDDHVNAVVDYIKNHTKEL